MLTGLLGALVVVARPNVATLTTLLLVAVVAGIGLYDDWQKISKKRPEGLSARYKFLLVDPRGGSGGRARRALRGRHPDRARALLRP